MDCYVNLRSRDGSCDLVSHTHHEVPVDGEGVDSQFKENGHCSALGAGEVVGRCVGER